MWKIDSIILAISYPGNLSQSHNQNFSVFSTFYFKYHLLIVVPVASLYNKIRTITLTVTIIVFIVMV